MEDYQFELDGVLFGMGCPVGVDEEGFDSGSNEIVTQDSENPFSDGTQFGRDLRRGATWTWSAFLDGIDEETALQALEDIATVWESEEHRTTLQDVRTLRYRINGRTRRVYGRPRRFAAPLSNRIWQGTSPVTMDFKKADPLHYDDAENSLSLQAKPWGGSGFLAPFTFPLTTVGETVAGATVVVGGRASTAPIVTFEGPGTDPKMTIGDFEIQVIGTLTADDVVEVDCRPWKMSVLLNGAPAATDRIRLSRLTRLSTSRLKPGTYAAAFLVVDATGTASATIRWRNAWPSI